MLNLERKQEIKLLYFVFILYELNICIVVNEYKIRLSFESNEIAAY